MTKYSDLESQDSETNQLTTNQIADIKKNWCKQEACWWSLILCPIGVAIGVCILLTLFILNQLEEKYALDNKDIIISNPWVIYGTDVVKCSPEEPCEMTCEEYNRESGNEAQECEFNYLWIMISGLVLGVCGSTLLCSFLRLCIGYICHPTEKKPGPKKNIPQYAKT